MEDPRPETGDQEPKQIPLRYLNSYPGLPASAPVGHPHIIGWDNEDTDKGSLTAADGIATLLFNWKPEALDAFLDFRHKPKYEWYRQTKPGSHIMDVLIARSGNVAVVRACRPITFVCVSLLTHVDDYSVGSVRMVNGRIMLPFITPWRNQVLGRHWTGAVSCLGSRLQARSCIISCGLRVRV